jgi:hypothetical protein
MKSSIQWGLIVGGVGLFLNIAVSGFVGLCGPFFTLLAGTLAGWLAVRGQLFPERGQRTTRGAVAGALTGGLMLIGQVIGGILALLFIQSSGAGVFGQPVPTEGPELTGFWVGGIAVGLCFGLIGTALGSAGGAGLAALTWSAPAPLPAPYPTGWPQQGAPPTQRFEEPPPERQQ